MLETAYFLTALISLGMAWAFVRADPDSSTSRALGIALAMTGFAIIGNNLVLDMAVAGPLPGWAGVLVVPEVIAFCAVFEWVHRVRRTIPAGELKTLFGDNSIRIAQGLVIVYGIASCRYPELRMREFFGGIHNPLDWSGPVIVMFAVPLSLAMLLWAGSILLCLNRRPDPAERVRLVAFLLACPLIAVGLVLPRSISPTTTTLGLIVLLAGAMRHAQLQGRRGLFMSRFLSPQVASLVNREGLRKAMQEDCLELSVVCCDLRGFTAFAGANTSEEVIQLLRDYYDAVGAVVLEVEGTIKDYAGDGVLILIGAPVRMDDHAQRAVRLADRIREVVTEVTNKWGRKEYPLGVGVGVASGPVTVGIIGGEGRLEYAAVGLAVNLASRLCEQAKPEEVLIDRNTFEVFGDQASAGFEPRDPLTLKGFREPVASFALPTIRGQFT
ncbi:MAG: adenylate/guanylate cyclase domain-containing protein [Gammaproteobacteria bacterium]|nr:adenylate/guanylate cyclase domain-containing protein [Gammaproteobacteria bacterium]